MKNVKHLLAGFVFGVLLAMAPSCGTAKNCSATTCPSGCCDAKGSCELGTSNGACGQLGSMCQACVFGQACNLGSCVATSGNGGGSNQGGGSGGGTGGGTTGGGTGGGTTGGGTGGGATGGGTGGGVTGGGGGSTCTGCFYGGTRPENCIVIANSGNNTICGQGGVVCAACGTNQNCVNYVCTGGTGGGIGGGTGGGVTGGGTGGGVTGGGTGGGTTGPQPVGGPCGTGIGTCQAGLTCRTTTAVGGNAYPSGYCSKPCTVQGDCGTGNDCIGGAQSTLQFYGEPSGFCANDCPSAGTQSTCRTGYKCEFNTAGLPGVCWLDPIPPFNGGALATNSGNACTADTCQPSAMNPLLGFCFKAVLPDAGVSGWTNGYCSADCSYDNTGAFCGTSATCVTFGTAPNDYSVCMKKCTMPGTRTECRGAGYICRQIPTTTTNYCYPDCTFTGCTAPQTCNTSTGACG